MSRGVSGAALVSLWLLCGSGCAQSGVSQHKSTVAAPSSPPPATSLAALEREATAAYERKDYVTCAHKSVEVASRAAQKTRTNPNFIGRMHYFAANCFALAGDRDSAFVHLGAVIEARYGSVDQMKQDTDFDNLHGDPRWEIALAAFEAKLAAMPHLPDPWQVAKAEADRGNYLTPLLELRRQEKDYLASAHRDLYLQVVATYLSYLGADAEALRYFDDFLGSDSLGDPAALDPSRYRMRDAMEYIAEAAGKHRVLFINEAHHVPRHRAFTLRLLKVLYDQGYRYFSAESLGDKDPELNKRGYPLLRKSGFYIDEPTYGELVRAAIKLGYKVVPYEHLPKCDPFKEKPSQCQNLRERGQAQNLLDRILRADPNAKMLVHAGYNHIGKQAVGDLVPMARYFQEITGVEPFCIDQVRMSERSEPRFEDPSYRLAIEKFKPSSSVVFVEQGGSAFVDPGRAGSYDAELFHPRTRQVNGRAD
jgi:hypothetical protein